VHGATLIQIFDSCVGVSTSRTIVVTPSRTTNTGEVMRKRRSCHLFRDGQCPRFAVMKTGAEVMDWTGDSASIRMAAVGLGVQVISIRCCCLDWKEINQEQQRFCAGAWPAWTYF